METFQVAHFKEQGVDVIVVFLDSSFDEKSEKEQNEAYAALQLCASSAGLKGTVALVWTVGNSMRFRAPQNWHPFFRSPNLYPSLVATINRELTCG